MAGDARGNVQALGEAIQVHRPGRPPEPARRVLDQVAGQAGDEADGEGDADPHAK